jgi:hypothetical protein
LVSRYGAAVNSEELIWLVELARKKAEYTPRLKKVHLIDWRNEYSRFLPGIYWPVCKFPEHIISFVAYFVLSHALPDGLETSEALKKTTICISQPNNADFGYS